MSEYEPHMTPEARPAPQRETPDWRRLESAANRYAQLIIDGIAEAQTERREIDESTARCIAHVLGRAYGRESALEGFGRTGEGHYLALRDEYLDLHGAEQAGTVIKEMIDWLGTYLVQRENAGSGRRFMNEHLPPKLSQLLVRTSIQVGDERFTVHIPADWDRARQDGLIETLAEHREFFGPAFHAFLSLPDVNAGSPDLIESFTDSYVGSFRSYDEALYSLSPIEEWETDLANWADDHGLPPDAVSLDAEHVMEMTRDRYDLVEHEGVLYAFDK